MNDFPASMVWCVIQVTLLSAAALVAVTLLRRIAPGTTALVTRLAVGGVLLLTPLALIPGPSWLQRGANVQDQPPAIVSTSVPMMNTANVDTIPATPAPTTTPQLEAQWDGTAAMWTEFLTQLDQLASAPPIPAAAPLAEQPTAPRWPIVLVSATLAIIVLGLIRLLIGALLVKRQVGRATPITTSSLLAQFEHLKSELKLSRRVELRESPELSTAATVGWRRPVVLLPPDWTGWSASECRAVLAHELAHVAQCHFLQWFVAQIGLSLHFYHPLMHWLVSRLRLEQEYEADGLAARVTGGAQGYIETLAALAMRQSDAPVSWLARPFWATRRTFLRRLQMLRGKPLLQRSSLTVRLTAATLVLAGVIIVAGIRPPANFGQDTATGDSSGPATQSPGAAPDDIIWPDEVQAQIDGPIELTYIPSDAIAVIAARPAKLLTEISRDEDLSRVLPMLVPVLEQASLPIGGRLKQTEQIVAVLTIDSFATPAESFNKIAATIHTRFVTPDAKADYLSALRGYEQAPVVAFGNASYRKLDDVCVFEPDDRTIIVNQEDALRRVIINGPKVRSPLVVNPKENDRAPSPFAVPSSESGLFSNRIPGSGAGATVRGTNGTEPEITWQALAPHAHLLAAIDVEILSRILATGMSPTLVPFTPIWDGTDQAAIGLQVTDGRLILRGALQSSDAEATQLVGETLNAARVLGKNSLVAFQRQLKSDPVTSGDGLLALLDAAASALDSMAITNDGNAVNVQSAVEIDPYVFAIVAQASLRAKRAADVASQRNHLKQLGIAFHSYHDSHGKFPPAVVVDEASGVPRSWRVELLPYLEHGELHAAYRKDLPWDSPENKAVLDAMPEVFGTTGHETRVMVVTGPGTIFDKPEGTWIGEIHDGTSNTILFVHHPTRTVPWTKPDDVAIVSGNWPVEFTDLGDLLQGDYDIAKADGSIHHMMPNPPAKALVRWFIKNDGGQSQPIFGGEVFPDPNPITIPGQNTGGDDSFGEEDVSDFGATPAGGAGVQGSYPGGFGGPPPERDE